MSERKVRYCALTTIAMSMRQFVMPSVTYMSNHGYDVTVGCANDEEFVSSLPNDIKFLPLDIERGYNLRKTISTIRLLYQYFKKNQIEMVEYGTENVSFCAAIAAWAAKVPIRIYNHWGARYIGFQGVSRQVSLFIERVAALFSTHVRQQSMKNMEMCVQDRVYPAHKVSVIGFGGTVGADFTKFDINKKDEYNEVTREKYSIPKEAIVFGDVGSIRKDKGTEELLEAFRNLVYDNAWLMLVGDVYEEDAPNEELLQWARESERVVFTGRVSDVERYVAAFDCMVHPSYREGLGMVLQEAGAMAVPYITTDIPGPSEFGINGKTGLLVEKGNAVDLQEKMEYLLENPQELKSMSKEVFQLTAERYERNVMVKRIFEDRERLRRGGKDNAF